jgi:hypothetical protein
MYNLGINHHCIIFLVSILGNSFKNLLLKNLLSMKEKSKPMHSLLLPGVGGNPGNVYTTVNKVPSGKDSIVTFFAND